MSTIDNLLEKKKQYYSLLDKVEVTKKNIDDSINYIDYGIESYQKSYTIDDKAADANTLSNVKNNLINISSRLSSNIEKINYELSSLGKQIDKYYEDAAVAAALAASAPKPKPNDSPKQPVVNKPVTPKKNNPKNKPPINRGPIWNNNQRW